MKGLVGGPRFGDPGGAKDDKALRPRTVPTTATRIYGLPGAARRALQGKERWHRAGRARSFIDREPARMSGSTGPAVLKSGTISFGRIGKPRSLSCGPGLRCGDYDRLWVAHPTSLRGVASGHRLFSPPCGGVGLTEGRATRGRCGRGIVPSSFRLMRPAAVEHRGNESMAPIKLGQGLYVQIPPRRIEAGQGPPARPSGRYGDRPIPVRRRATKRWPMRRAEALVLNRTWRRAGLGG